MRPIIGIPCHRPYYEPQPEAMPRYVLNRAYAEAVRQAGGAPVLLPACNDPDVLRPAYGAVAGLLLPGGGDVAPGCYGQADGGKLLSVDEERDEAELLLARWALGDDLPILAICRGIQMLNVALGGSLIQDIPTQVPGALEHSPARGTPRDLPRHEVSLAAGSRLAAALGRTQTQVNSFHHQAVQEVAGCLRVAARAPDGIVEGLEWPERRFVVGVQWHPEEMTVSDPAQAALFAAFVAACTGRRG